MRTSRHRPRFAVVPQWRAIHVRGQRKKRCSRWNISLSDWTEAIHTIHTIWTCGSHQKAIQFGIWEITMNHQSPLMFSSTLVTHDGPLRFQPFRFAHSSPSPRFAIAIATFAIKVRASHLSIIGAGRGRARARGSVNIVSCWRRGGTWWGGIV